MRPVPGSKNTGFPIRHRGLPKNRGVLSPMYIPTYKQIMLLIAGLIFTAVSVAKLSHLHNTPRDEVINADGARILDKFPVPMPLVKTKQILVANQELHNTSAHAIWYSWTRDSELVHAESIANSSIPNFCEYVKNTTSKPAGSRHVATALWYLSHNESKFAQFRTRRVDSYDKDLEAAVEKSMADVIRGILSKFGSFKIGHDDHGSIHLFKTGDHGDVSFDMPSLRTLADIESFFVFALGDAYATKENVWIHHVWHAMRTIFPALRSLYLTGGPLCDRNFTVKEIASIGHCVGVEQLKLNSCIDAGQLKYLNGSILGNSIDTLILGDLKLHDTDISTISGFSMRELFFYRTSVDARDNNLARILEQEPVVYRLTKLHIVLMDDTDVSAREKNAISSLRNIRALSLKGECKGCISHILKNAPISARLRELTLASPEGALFSDIDTVADIRVDFLSISYRKTRSVYLSRISSGAAGLSITRLEIKNAEARNIFENLPAFKNLRSLKLEQYSASVRLRSELASSLVKNKSIRRLELVNERLLPPLRRFVAKKADLEELVLSIDELDGSELAAVLADKNVLRTLEVTGGNVTGHAVSAIAGLGALTRLKIKDASMSYDDLIALAGNEDLRRRMGRKLRLRTKTPLVDKRKVDVLHVYGLDYRDGLAIL